MPTREVTELNLTSHFYHMAVDGNDLFFTDRTGKSVHIYSFRSGTERKSITFETWTRAIALDTSRRQVFVWVGSIGIKTFSYEGSNMTSLLNDTGNSYGMAVDETNA